MTCKDCIHYDVCNKWDTWNDEFYTDGNSNKCYNYSKFKDKSRFIELPCKVVTGVSVRLSKGSRQADINNGSK